jgi:hypothetical protein
MYGGISIMVRFECTSKKRGLLFLVKFYSLFLSHCGVEVSA